MQTSFSYFAPSRDSTINVKVIFVAVCFVDGPMTVHQCCSVNPKADCSCDDDGGAVNDSSVAEVGRGPTEVCSVDVERGPTVDGSMTDETRSNDVCCDEEIRPGNDGSTNE